MLEKQIGQVLVAVGVQRVGGDGLSIQGRSLFVFTEVFGGHSQAKQGRGETGIEGQTFLEMCGGIGISAQAQAGIAGVVPSLLYFFFKLL